MELKRSSKRYERTEKKRFNVAPEERVVLEQVQQKYGCNSLMDTIFAVIKENEILTEKLEKKNYRLQQEDISEMNKKLKRQDSELKIIKNCLSAMMGPKEFNKVLATLYKGTTD